MKGTVVFIDGKFYIQEPDGKLIPVAFGASSGGGGLSKGQVINLINQFSGGGGSGVIPFAIEINLVSTTGDTQTLSADALVGTPISYLWRIKGLVTVPNNFPEGVGGILNIGADNQQQATFIIGQGQIAFGMVSCQVTDANGQVTSAEWFMMLNQAA